MYCENKEGETIPFASMNPVGKPPGMYMVVPVEMLLLLPHPKFAELDPGKKSSPRL